MEALGYFVFWALANFVMMRFGCGAHATGHRNEPPPAAGRTGLDGIRWIPPEKDRDPVCGKLVRTDTAKPSVYDGSVYYFCSRECRERFEATPESYVAGGIPDGRQQEKGAIAKRSHALNDGAGQRASGCRNKNSGAGTRSNSGHHSGHESGRVFRFDLSTMCGFRPPIPCSRDVPSLTTASARLHLDQLGDFLLGFVEAFANRWYVALAFGPLYNALNRWLSHPRKLEKA